MTKYLTFGIALLFLFMSATPSLALKKRNWTNVKAPAITTTKTTTSTGSVGISARRKGNDVYVSFSNLTSAKSVSYELTYTTNGIDQGVFGSVATTSKSLTKNLYLGTVSSKYKRPHTNIAKLRLTVIAKLNNGKTLTKRLSFK